MATVVIKKMSEEEVDETQLGEVLRSSVAYLPLHRFRLVDDPVDLEEGEQVEPKPEGVAGVDIHPSSPVHILHLVPQMGVFVGSFIRNDGTIGYQFFTTFQMKARVSSEVEPEKVWRKPSIVKKQR